MHLICICPLPFVGVCQSLCLVCPVGTLSVSLSGLCLVSLAGWLACSGLDRCTMVAPCWQSKLWPECFDYPDNGSIDLSAAKEDRCPARLLALPALVNKRACACACVRLLRVRVRPVRVYPCALCVRWRACACASACASVCACACLCAGAWGSASLSKSESSPRLSSSFLGRYACATALHGSLCVPIQGVARLDSPMVQGHRLDQPSGAVRGYPGMLTFDRQDHDRRRRRTRTARQRQQEEQARGSSQDSAAAILGHGAHSVRSFG
ncbi:hypothetical protein [Providencia phage PSTNGR1]|uniref:Uncharacterized protein n=1 Tax=Providencia phage PSTNGR1 TaxID=2783542 RepID=A0A873WWD3_9CAUD|nr:hypothetical protein [Providencia phage PSTNGR1]